MFNEERTIKVLLEKVIENLNQNDEIIIIDDFSTDKTRNILRNQFENSVYKIIYNEKNYGKGFSIRQGIKAATGEIILIQDADLEYDPSDYKKLTDPIKNNIADVVYGSRFIGSKERRVLFFWHRLGNLVNLLLKYFLFFAFSKLFYKIEEKHFFYSFVKWESYQEPTLKLNKSQNQVKM